jgi:hypothetical protein
LIVNACSVLVVVSALSGCTSLPWGFGLRLRSGRLLARSQRHGDLRFGVARSVLGCWEHGIVIVPLAVLPAARRRLAGGLRQQTRALDSRWVLDLGCALLRPACPARRP